MPRWKQQLISWELIKSDESCLSRWLISVCSALKRINHQGLEMCFSVPNELNHFRATTFSTKEPETLEWIDGLPEGCVLWDIGANVGLYTVYAALRKKCHIVAFEPSVFNLELLSRNLYLNGLHQQVTLLPLALSDKMGSNLLHMTSTEWGEHFRHLVKMWAGMGNPFRRSLLSLPMD